MKSPEWLCVHCNIVLFSIPTKIVEIISNGRLFLRRACLKCAEKSETENKENGKNK